MIHKYMYNHIEVNSKNEVYNFPTSSNLVLDVTETCFIFVIDFLK